MLLDTLLTFSELSDIELSALKTLIDSVDNFYTEFDADIESIQQFYIDEIQGLLLMIKIGDLKNEGSAFLYGWSSIYDQMKTYFNCDREEEGYNYSLDFVFNKLTEFINDILTTRNDEVETIMYHFCAEAEGIIITNEDYYNNLTYEEQEEYC